MPFLAFAPAERSGDGSGAGDASVDGTSDGTGWRDEPRNAARLILVTGPAGAGRSTAINALEDLGHEVIDNLPLSLLPRLVERPLERTLAIGIGVNNRDFTTDGIITLIEGLAAREDLQLSVVYLDCGDGELLRRYASTRRRHPFATGEGPMIGIQREKELLIPIRARADVLIDTDGLSPHDLAREVEHWFAPESGRQMTVALHSFSYKRGLPRGIDMVFDCRFLRNPHWDASLRSLDGRDAPVQDFVTRDSRFAPFMAQMNGLLDLMLPAARAEGKAHLAIGFGCSGGQHRSVTLVETLGQALAQQGWAVSKRHRELERHLDPHPSAAERGQQQ